MACATLVLIAAEEQTADGRLASYRHLAEQATAPDSILNYLEREVLENPDASVWVCQIDDVIAAVAIRDKRRVDASPDVESRLALRRADQARDDAIHTLIVSSLAKNAGDAYRDKSCLIRTLVATTTSDTKSAGTVGPGLQSKSMAINGNGWAIVWVSAPSIRASGHWINSPKLKDAYAGCLRLRARNLMSQNQLSEADAVFFELERLRPLTLEEQLDRLRLSHRIGTESNTCLKLHELWQASMTDLDAEQAEHIGDVALELECDSVALEAFRFAMDNL